MTFDMLGQLAYSKTCLFFSVKSSMMMDEY